MKRISARAIIFEGDYFYALFRRKIKDGNIHEYYSIPGGGVEFDETLEETVKRELKEEFQVEKEKILNAPEKKDTKIRLSTLIFIVFVIVSYVYK